ncbi:MAG TPA: lysine--tRNA ligase [Gemmatimonadales bacterium]|nr:lysine--tRNA ligase [Gemmatimonadales bacterium]
MSGETESYVEAARREKLTLLRERGITPFAYAYARSHTTAEALAAFDESEVPVRVAGRIVALRGHGKTTFAHLEDAAGRLQLYFRQDALGEDGYAVVKLLDLGDVIGVAGVLFRTRTGEITVRATELSMLAKALRPLPLGKADAEGEQHGILTDAETRYRERYADLAVHPEVREIFRVRAQTVSYLRGFLDGRHFTEVETPVLQPLYGGAMARPFVTHHHALDRRFYLRIATELYLKRCIVGGMERVYELGKDFRNEGIDRTHNPEFTMLEFYQAYADYLEILALTEELLAGVVRHVCGTPVIERFGRRLDFTPPFRRATYEELVREHTGLDTRSASDDELRALLAQQDVSDVASLPRTKLVDEIFKVAVEPTLQDPTFVLDFPIELSPLAKPKRGDPALAERFELFVLGRELANAFSELNDPDDQRARFAAQAAARAAGDHEAQQTDEDYVRALEYGMPPTGGIGIGIDRLVMVLAEQASIRDVILFPMLRTEE